MTSDPMTPDIEPAHYAKDECYRTIGMAAGYYIRCRCGYEEFEASKGAAHDRFRTHIIVTSRKD